MSTTERIRFELREVGDVTVVTLTDRKIIENQLIQDLIAQLLQLVDEGYKKILIDFKRVQFLSSDMLGGLITLDKKIKHISGQLVLCEVVPEAYVVFDYTKLNKLFVICGDETTGLSRF